MSRRAQAAATRRVAFSCGSVKANFEVRLLHGTYFGNVDVGVADRVGLDLALFALAGDGMPLQAAVQGRAR